MFLLNNIHDRKYGLVYPKIKHVIFDLSADQLRNTRNRHWKRIHDGDIVCVISSSRRVDTFFRVKEIRDTDVPDENGSLQHVIIGERQVAARLLSPKDMTVVLNEWSVSNKRYLPGNKFGIGVNVVDLGDQLASLEVAARDGNATVGELESAARNGSIPS